MQKLLSYIFLGTIFSLVFVKDLEAQSYPTDTLRLALPEVSVFGKSEIFKHAFNSHRIQVVSSSEFLESNSNDLGQILQNHSGAFIKTYGPGLSSFSFRGLSSSQSSLALDGIPLSSPQLGSFDLSIIPSLALETVEIAYGGASSFVGSSGMSGMVNMTTTPQNQQSSYLVKSSLGQFGERSSAISLTHWLGQRTWLKFSGETGRSESDYGVLDRNLLEPVRIDQQGWDSNSKMALVGIGHRQHGHHLQLKWWGRNAERGLGFARGEERGARQWDTSQRVWLSDELESYLGKFKAQVLWQSESLRYARPFPYQDGESDVLDDTGDTKLWRSELSWQSRWSSSVDLGTSIYYSTASAQHPSLGENPKLQNLGMSLKGEWSTSLGKLNHALRLDRHFKGDLDDTQWLPSLGFKRSFKNLSFKANASRVYRTPSLNDLYWQPGGNLDLLPESGTASDLGFAYLTERSQWLVTSEVTLFYQRVKNQIVWIDEGSFWSPNNIGKVRSHGLEWSLQGAKRQGILQGFGVFVTRTESTDRTEEGAASFGKQLRYTPKYQLKANTQFRMRNWSASLNLISSSKRYITSDESQFLDPYFLLGSRLGYSQKFSGTEGLVSLSIENALDSDYEIISSYGMPPRVFRIEIILSKRN